MKNYKGFSRCVTLLLTFAILFTNSVAAVSADECRNVSVIEESLSEEAETAEENTFEEDGSEIAEEGMILNYVDEEEFLSAQHVERLTELEDLNTYLFENADGTRSVYIMQENVRYIDQNGKIREKDISLKELDDGYETVQNDVELWIPEDLEQGIGLKYSGFSVTLIPQNLTDDVSAERSGNSVVYEEAFTSNSNLVYTPVLSGIKEDIILTEPVSDASYTFLLQTNGLHIFESNGEYNLAESGRDDPVFRLGEILIYDAAGKPSYGTMCVKTVVEEQEYLLTVTADREFLQDPSTVYPVTIDPSVTVSDSNTTDSVIDAPVYQGYPDRNFGSYVYNRLGTPSDKYGIGRTVVRLSGLTESEEYQSLTADQIQSALFYVKDSSSGSASVHLYPMTGNSSWTESSVTWNNLGTYTTAADYGSTMSSGQWAEFDITELVQAWKNGTYSADAGFLMMNSDETGNKSFFSSEYSTASYKPYIVITYETAVSLNTSSVSIAEGRNRILSATTRPGGQTVTWTTSNSNVATVNPSGIVIAQKAGTAVITASITDTDGVTHRDTCTVYVYLTGGVYQIRNLNSNNCLQVKDGGIADRTDVCQDELYPDSENVLYRIRQMWKIHYLGDGRYSIRPMSKPDMGLDVLRGNVDIYHAGAADTLSGTPYYEEWTIGWESTGYVFRNNGKDTLTMQVQYASVQKGATVLASAYSGSTNCRWNVTKISSPPAGAYWFDTNANKAILLRTAGIGIIDCGSSSDSETLGYIPVFYSPLTNNQTFTWSSADASVATVDPNSGLISAISADNVTVTATAVYGNYQLRLNIMARSLDPFHRQNIQDIWYYYFTGTNLWGLGGNTDHTVSIVMSTRVSYDYCIVRDNIHAGYSREFCINDDLKNTLKQLDAGYYAHYDPLPIYDQATEQEYAAHYAKEETDQLVDGVHFLEGSSAYYGVWAYNYVSSLNLVDSWGAAIDQASAAYQVYLSLTAFYYSYMMSTCTVSTEVTSSQYETNSSILDDIDDALSGIEYSDKTVLSAESRNAEWAQKGYTSPFPYEPQTPVVQYQQTGSTQYVRVFVDADKRYGHWLMKYSDIEGLTAAEIQSKFALPSTPVYYCNVNVPAGKTLYVGVVNQSSVSGTLQYEIVGDLVDIVFGGEILLP